MARFAALLIIPCLCACSMLHHAQLGDMDTRVKGHKFDVKVSELGISLDEARRVANAFASKADRGNVGEAGAILSLFQMGPRTGNGVFNDSYAEGLVKTIYEKCPSGRVTGLLAVRETMKYPVISGEIVHLTGICVGGS